MLARPGARRELASVGQLGLVAGSLDRLDEPAGGDRRRVELDARRLGGVVDARGDAVELVQLALDAIGAGGAGHARDRQLDALAGALTVSPPA